MTRQAENKAQQVVPEAVASFQKLVGEIFRTNGTLLSTADDLAGDLDFMAHLAVRDAQHLRQFVMEHVASRPEIDKVETRLVYESVASQRLPFYRADAPSS